MIELIPKQLSEDLNKDVNKKDAQISYLESRLSQEMDQRKEERFYWIFFGMMAGNAVAFSFIENIIGIVVIAISELIAISLLARRLGVDYYEEYADKALSFFSSIYTNKKP